MIVSGQVKIEDDEHNSDRTSVIAYETFDYLREIIESNRKRPHRHNGDRLSESRDFSRSWEGVTSYKEAEDLAINGWKEAEENKELNNIFNLQVNEEDKLISFKNDVVGYTPVVPLVLQGIPNCMTNVTKKRVKSKIIHIAYNISTTCGTSSEQIMKAGIELFKVIMQLERQGYRVRLTAMQDFTNYKGSNLMILNLKSEYKPLHITSMMFPLLHPAMFRVLGFAWFERSPISWEMDSYGTSYDNKFSRKSFLIGIKEILKAENLIYFRYRDLEDKTADEIIDKIKEQIK